MTLLAWPALILLIAVPVLIALAAWRQGPKRHDVGTLLIWQRLVQQASEQKRKRRKFDPLLWLLLATVVVGAVGAARPGAGSASGIASVAVFVESSGAVEPNLEAVKKRASEIAPGTELKFFGADFAGDGDEVSLRAGPVHAELAQFQAQSGDFSSRLMFLNAPLANLPAGRVLPRVDIGTDAVVYQIRGGHQQLIVRASTGSTINVEGATLVREDRADGGATYVYEPTSAELVFTDANGKRRYVRRTFMIGEGQAWATDAHRALLAALEPDVGDGREPDVWLGSTEYEPAVRINRGETGGIGLATMSYDPQHPLFRDVPMGDFDWLESGRAMAPVDGVQVLMTAVVDGRPAGDLVRLRNAGRVLEFAGDPFSSAPVASAVLLLDNAIGVVAKTRPSERPGFEMVEGPPLPSRRQALAQPFEPSGELDLSTRSGTTLEFTSWLSVIGAVLLLVCCWICLRPKENARASSGVLTAA